MTYPLPFVLCALLASAASSAASAPTRAALPLHFEANHGQTDARVQFIGRAGEHAVYLGRGEAFIALDESSNVTRVVRLSFPGADPSAAGTGVEKFAGRVNYLLGTDPAGWHTGIPAYGKVEYPQMYPGVDLVFHGRQQMLEYDFVVAPGAKAEAISIRLDGADRIQLDDQGDLLIHAGTRHFRQHAPKAWQTRGGLQVAVPVRYAFKDARTVTFTLGAYDQARELVIDPVISYSTYLGGSGRDRAWTVAVDGSGSAYVGGDTRSVLKDLPVSGVQTRRGSSNGDGFVAKLNADGSGFDYLTYLGGNDIDAVTALALDAGNNAYLAGYTASPNFPITPGAFRSKMKTSKAKGSYTVYRADAFLAKLSPAGDSLIYSTFYGGAQTDGALGVAVDGDGHAVLCGFTESKDLPTNNAVQPKFKGGTDAFVAKFNADASALIFGTYFGGSGREYANSVAVNGAGDAYVAGWAESGNLFVTNYPGLDFYLFYGEEGGRNVFLTRFNSTGTVLSSTFIGSKGNDMAYSVALDAQSNVYLAGSKASTAFPVTAGINDGGVFASTDAADSWNSASQGLIHNSIQALAVSSANPLAVLAGTPLGLFASIDGGGTWFFDHPLALQQRNISAITLDPSDSRTWYLGTSLTVLKSTNVGSIWTTNNTGLNAGNIRALVFQPGLSSTLYAGSYGGGVFVSTNAAESWIRISSGLGSLFINGLAVDPIAPATLYAATDGGIYKSTNSGVKWFSRNTGLTPSKRAQAILLDLSSPSTIYAGTSRGLFKSIDGADTWSHLGSGMSASNITALAYDSAGSALYVGTTNGLFKSTDGGVNFAAKDSGLNTRAIQTLALAPSSPDTLYTGLKGKNTFGGTNDAFLMKLTPDIFEIIYSVVLGGSKGDEGFSAAVAADGSVVFAGATASRNFPIVDAPSAGQSTNAGKSDAWVAHIDPAASSLIYSFYLGGKENDYGEAVALDSAGNAYVAGYTSSKNFPTVGAIQDAYSGGADAFVTKVSAAVPVLLVEAASDHVIARWPASATGFHLETSEDSAGSWRRVSEPSATRGDWNIVVFPAADAGPFFRLRRP